MPTLKFTDSSDEGKKRDALIDSILPTTQITGNMLSDTILKRTKRDAIEMLRKEIEIYRAYPKKGEYNPDTFNSRNSKECFMGQGFTHNGRGFEGWYDYDLVRYRKAIGTIPHPTWGNCTLLEIWGGDHYEKHFRMVKNVFEYGWGKRDKMPVLKFFVNPFVKNDQSGTWDPDPVETREQDNREHLIKIANYMEIRDRMKKAGVKSPMDLAIYEVDDPVKKKQKRF
jgi:hypothetical protein